MTAVTESQSSGDADTVPPGSRGTWVNGEMSSTQCDSWITWPKMFSATARPTAVQLTAADTCGSRPNTAIATPAITSAAGSSASPAPSMWLTHQPVPPARRP